MVTKSNLQSLTRDTPPYHYWASIWSYFSVSKLSFVHRLHLAETGSRPINGSYDMSSNANHVALNTHAKRTPWCWTDNMRRLVTLLAFSPAHFKQFLTVLADRCLFGKHCLFRTGLVGNGIRLIKECSFLSSRCDVWSSGSWQFISRCWYGCVILTSRLTTV